MSNTPKEYRSLATQRCAKSIGGVSGRSRKAGQCVACLLKGVDFIPI